MALKKILLQFDPDPHCSVFDAVVAIDSEVDHLLQYAGVQPADVRDLVYGAMFTRGPEELCNSAVFIGGRDVTIGERLLEQVRKSFLGPLRISVLLDANGANTTAAAAVVAAERHVSLHGATALVLAATGPVGQRVVRMLATAGAEVCVASRQLDRAAAVCQAISNRLGSPNSQGQEPVEATLRPVQTDEEAEVREAIDGVDLVIAAGASGVQLLSQEIWQSAGTLQVAIDLNAVPPLGIEGMDVSDKARRHQETVTYGAIGVGGTKMKIHKESIRRLFQRNDQVFDADEVFAIARELEAERK